jgi:TonB family protein
MKRLILVGLLLLTATASALAESGAAAQQLLVSAERQVDLFSHDASPFQLEVDYSAQVNVPTQGHLKLVWESKDRWVREVSLGDFRQLEIKNGEKLYTRRNVPFTPLRVRQLLLMLYVSDDPGSLRIKKEKQRIERGLLVSCIEVRTENKRNSDHQICVNPASHEIAVDEWKEEPDGRVRKEYSDYSEFRGLRYPRTIERFENGIKVITAHVLNLTTAPIIDDASLVPPKGSIERRQCADMKHPIPVKNPDPAYPKSAAENRLGGKTTVSMTVLADGSVDNIQLIGSAGHSMDDATLQTLKRWTFKPAMCGPDPVVSDISVEVNFHLQ